MIDYAKISQHIFTKFGGKAVHDPRKKPLDFCGNPDHVTLGLESGIILLDKSYPVPLGVLPGVYLTVPVLRDYGYAATSLISDRS